MSLNIRKEMVDQTKEMEGVWFTWREARWKVARQGNALFQAASIKASMDKLVKTSKIRDASDITEENARESAKLTKEQIARHILKGWEDVTDYEFDKKGNVVKDKDGKPKEIEVKYSYENALKLLTECPELEDAIDVFSKDLQKFKVRQYGEDAKN